MQSLAIPKISKDSGRSAAGVVVLVLLAAASHLAYLGTPPVNLEFSFIDAAKYFSTGNPQDLAQYFYYEANTLAIPWIAAAIHWLIPGLGIEYIPRLLAVASVPFLAIGLLRINRQLGKPVTPYLLLSVVLFNPLEWKKRLDNTLFPIKNGNETGAGAAVVTKITPLYFIITFDSVETNGAAPRYVIGVERQAADKPAMRHKQQHYASLGEKKDFFILSEVNGDPADPSGLVLKLTDNGDMVTVSKDKPFQRVENYAADLKYDLEKPVKNFAGLRAGSRLSFGGEDYIVVAVDADEVILSAQSNQKKTTLPYAP